MTSPITIPDLDPAGAIDPANDYVIVRQGLNDKKATVDQINQPAVALYPALPNALTSSDLILVNRGGVNYSVNPQALGFLVDTYAWFYQTTAPLNWTIVPNSGDRILGTSDANGNLYNGAVQGTISGTWLQQDVFGVAGMGLALNQMPLHGHRIRVRANAGSNPTGVASGSSGTQTIIGSSTANFPIEMTGDNSGTNGTSAPHNHGQTWRPAALVGILCRKTS